MHARPTHTHIRFVRLTLHSNFSNSQSDLLWRLFFFSSSPLCSSVASHISCYNLCFLAIERNLLFLHIRFLIVFYLQILAYSSIISDFTIIFVISFGFRILIEIDEWERKTRMKRDKKWKSDFNVIDFNGSLFSFFYYTLYLRYMHTFFPPYQINQKLKNWSTYFSIIHQKSHYFLVFDETFSN